MPFCMAPVSDLGNTREEEGREENLNGTWWSLFFQKKKEIFLKKCQVFWLRVFHGVRESRVEIDQDLLAFSFAWGQIITSNSRDLLFSLGLLCCQGSRGPWEIGISGRLLVSSFTSIYFCQSGQLWCKNSLFLSVGRRGCDLKKPSCRYCQEQPSTNASMGAAPNSCVLVHRWCTVWVLHWAICQHFSQLLSHSHSWPELPVLGTTVSCDLELVLVLQSRYPAVLKTALCYRQPMPQGVQLWEPQALQRLYGALVFASFL